ncbi:MAG: aldehyde ferredoxin oxidoreductase family protein [Chloroflexota bacterium]|nr:aldehyde ferredoxin oxidoreductase family protein [Chloroflexota bacterium]
MRSFHNRILRANLTDGTIKIEELGEITLRRYMGGWNIIADVLLKEVPQGADPLGPENKVIFAPGVVCGVPISGSARTAMGAKSPLTGAFGGSEAAGSFGPWLKRSGVDAVIVEGASETPVYLWVKDGEAEIRDASHLWGKTTKETQEMVREEIGDRRAELAMIGPAGENMVRYANVMHGLKDAAGRSGMGAVMGSKKLKAVVASATMNLDGADAETIREMARRAAREVQSGERAEGLHRWGTAGGPMEDGLLSGNLPVRNFRDGEFDDIAGLEYVMDKIGVRMEGCWACAVRCKKVVEAETDAYKVDPDYGGPEYETLGSLGSNCGVSDVVAVSIGGMLCNAYSLDTIGTGLAISFAMECYENGLLTKEDTYGLDLRFGNGDAMIEMVEKIAHREEGLADLLADGLVPAAKEIGGDSMDFAMQVKGQALPMHEPRLKRALAIGYAVSPTGADHVHSLHDTGLEEPDENGFLPNERLRSMGVLEPMELESLGPEKVRAAMYHSIAVAMLNSITMCTMPGWNLQDLSDIVQAATGWDVTEYELLKVGERALTLARVFNMREGLTVEDDRLPERSYGPTRGGALSDGGIDREELREAVHTFYAMMGWDKETGVPTVEKLQELGVGWAAEYLPK